MYKLIKKVFVSAAVACFFPVVAYADFIVSNNTNFYATADASNPKTGYHSPCSSTLPGGAGIIKPYDQAFGIPTWAIGLVCNPSCDIAVYLSKNCDEQHKFADIPVTSDATIGKPISLPNEEGVYVNRKSSTEVSIEKG